MVNNEFDNYFKECPELSVKKSTGVTPSEEKLCKLGYGTFLSLWSYPNVFQKHKQVKELCDLLVVFENHIIIFSDKKCKFGDSGDINVDWIRWYKKSILASARQLRGAKTWIANHPDRICLDDSYKDSIYNKLLPMVGVLNKYDKSVLRLHSGEFANTETNTENILETLVRICNDLGINIPPPEVRVGHGLHIEENKRLVDLLRLFDCIVEVNASSNFALGHVKDLREIPYQFYLDNGIRVVLSTDGGGFYSTSNGQEKMIASTFVDVEDLEKILESDRDIYSRKAGEVIHEKRVGR